MAFDFLPQPGKDSFEASFPRELKLILTWGIETHQSGPYRFYAAASLIVTAWRQHRSVHGIIQRTLLAWLEEYGPISKKDELANAGALLGELITKNVFPYQEYLNRLTASGYVAKAGDVHSFFSHPSPRLIYCRKMKRPISICYVGFPCITAPRSY